MLPASLPRKVLATLLIAAFSAISADTGRAAKDSAHPVAGPRFELLVLEIRDCDVCEVIREKIQPAYDGSARSKRAPMRFVDITSINELDLGLRTKVRTMPTVVLMKDGREVDRLSGFMSAELYIETLNSLVDAAR